MKLIYAIPGLGTTDELFANISVPGYTLKVLSWPVPQADFTLSDYAAEFLKQVDASAPVNLLGVSFGGMLCAELADRINVNKVVLISSCKNRFEFPKLLRLLKRFPLHKLFSEQSLKTLAKYSRPIIGFEKKLVPVFVKMINSMPPGYFSRCTNYIINWDKIQSNPNLISIHGTADRLLTYKQNRYNYTIKNGTHAMVFYKAAEINTILNKLFNGL